MSKRFEILAILNEVIDRQVSLGDAMNVATRVEALYTFNADAWVNEHLSEFTNPPRKIQAIKELRAASQAYQQDQWLGLKEAKDIIMEAFKTSDALQALRDKLESLDQWSEPYDLGENEDRAYAEHRERQAERGTWFGIDGPYEEPF